MGKLDRVKIKTEDKPRQVANVESILMRTIVNGLPVIYRQNWDGNFEWEYEIDSGHFICKLELRHPEHIVVHRFSLADTDTDEYVEMVGLAVGKAICAEIKTRLGDKPSSMPSTKKVKRRNPVKHDDLKLRNEFRTMKEERAAKKKAQAELRKVKKQKITLSNSCDLCGETNPDLPLWEPCPHAQ